MYGSEVIYCSLLKNVLFQNLIDYNFAVSPQLAKLGDRYLDWVNSPVDRPVIFYDNPIAEYLMKVSELQKDLKFFEQF